MIKALQLDRAQQDKEAAGVAGRTYSVAVELGERSILGRVWE